MRLYAFDVAVVPAGLSREGRRDIAAPSWFRAVVATDAGLVDAHLAAAQIVGRRGMVVDVLYRD